jgi:hypothetical protein
MKYCLLLLATLLLAGGCTFYSQTRIIRGEEARIAVTFETEEAARLFQETAKLREYSNKPVRRSRTGLPLVNFYVENEQLGSDAFYNDQVAICDTDKSLSITESEARIYRELYYKLGH